MSIIFGMQSRRQQWNTGARASSTSSNFIFSLLYFEVFPTAN